MSWKKRMAQIDFGLIGVLTSLALLGFFALWSASHGADGQVANHAFRQIRWLGIGLVAMGVFAAIDYRHLQTNVWPIYGGLVLLLVLVLVSGKSSMGAQRWLTVGPFRVQPSTTPLNLALYSSARAPMRSASFSNSAPISSSPRAIFASPTFIS